MNDNNAILSILAAEALLVLLFACFVGCKQVQYIPVERVAYQNSHDTIMRTDSVREFRYIYMRGDTVHDVQYRDRWRVQERTIEITRIDSIPYAVEVVREVRRRNSYDKFTSCGFWVLALAICAAIGIRIFVRFGAFKFFK